MAQQINLYVDSLRRPRQAFTAGQTLLLVVLVTSGCAATSALLQWQSRDAAQRTVALQQATSQLQVQLAARQASSPTTRVATQEVERLRQRALAQQRVQSALEAGSAQATGSAPSEYLLALARQAHPSVWITGLAVSADERAIELRGRMLDASVLPDYLRRLNAEARFKGRSFARLEIKSPDPANAAAATPYPEFVLRSSPGGRDGEEPSR
jgi:hypothetical protein